MPTPQQLLCATLTLGCVLSAAPAEARFGKAGGSGSSSSGSSGGPRSPSQGGSGGSRAHDASPVRTGASSRPPPSPEPRTAAWTGVEPRPAWIAGGGLFGVPLGFRPYRGQEEERDEERRHPLMVRLGLQGGAVREGGSLGFHFGLDGRRWGMSSRLTALTLRTDDGTAGRDHIQLMEVHATFSPLAGKRGRLRLEGGVAAARAPHVTFIGPSLGASFERCLIGALDLEGRLQFVPLPHLQVDAQLALAVHLGRLSLRAGWRGLALDDRGFVDGHRNQDALGGPFGGVGLSF